MPQKQVTPPKEVYDRIKADNILIGKARSIDSDLTFFKEKFQPNKRFTSNSIYLSTCEQFFRNKIGKNGD